MTRIEIFKKMLDWLCANIEDVKNQTDVARAAGLNETSVSRIMNGRVKSVKPETLRAVNAAYGNVFNPEWLRGDSDVMLVAELNTNDKANGTPRTGVPSPTLPDMTAIVAAKDETIAALQAQISAKDDTINAKNALIDALQQQLATLRTQLAIEKGISLDGTFLSELAERKSQHRQNQ